MGSVKPIREQVMANKKRILIKKKDNIGIYKEFGSSGVPLGLFDDTIAVSLAQQRT